MLIRRYESDLLCSSMYLITEQDHAIVIDPCRNTTVMQTLQIDKIILTHEHYDHISGVNVWKHLTNAPVLCSKTCGENIRSSRKNMARFFEVFCELQTWMKLDTIPESDETYTCETDEIFEDEMKFNWQGHIFHLFEMPGHSLGSIGILLDNQHFFSGDSLIEGRDIELRFPGGSKEMWEKLGAPRLARIPAGVHVYPGHFKEFIYRK